MVLKYPAIGSTPDPDKAAGLGHSALRAWRAASKAGWSVDMVEAGEAP